MVATHDVLMNSSCSTFASKFPIIIQSIIADKESCVITNHLIDVVGRLMPCMVNECALDIK